ncbi:MAG: hypothetical protein CBC48_14385 [bacterium TMED88]|nr:hypothetical protein [Deltaproteobacteria bacterium]OUV27390.1 MAG: hypothetical protein CBC48_14385 [bacterium TMED88]
MIRIAVLGVLAYWVGSAGWAQALPALDYSRQESTRCSYAQGCPRMLRNATGHAEQFCREEGGILKGASKRDYSCEQRGIYCVVRGRIECRGRLNPAKVPGPEPLRWPEGQSVPARSDRTCLDRGCDRFVSHSPGIQDQGTHACPFGYLVAGVSGRGNDLICEAFAKPVRQSGIEQEVQRNRLLACPSGWVVRGVSSDRKTLLCARMDAKVLRESVEEEVQDRGLQICEEPSGEDQLARFVTGLNADRTRLMCAELKPE